MVKIPILQRVIQHEHIHDYVHILVYLKELLIVISHQGLYHIIYLHHLWDFLENHPVVNKYNTHLNKQIAVFGGVGGKQFSMVGLGIHLL